MTIVNRSKSSQILWFFLSACLALAAFTAPYLPAPIMFIPLLGTSFLLFLKGRKELCENKNQIHNITKKMKLASIAVVLISVMTIILSPFLLK
ncbi:MAG: hypothetical protein COB83_11400 [Gammaproteobacteria bacterium]|nr:MAG: hypothetical protein COB83_11400 [Gammaproteobacteria bacterium]